MELSVSIIVPVYNVEKYIKDCFESIISQTYIGPMECLFIDDCGTDNSIELLEDLMQAYDGPFEMRLIHHEKNSGLSAARNTGVRDSKGDYIFFLDSDDQIYPQAIAHLTRAAIDENLPDLVLGSYQVNIPDHVINRYKFKYDVLRNPSQIVNEFLNGNLFCMAHNKLIRRGFVSDNNLWFKEGVIHEDNLWSFQSFHLAQSVVTIPEITYFYLIRDDSIMTSGRHEKSLLSTVEIYNEIKNDLSMNRYGVIDGSSLQYIKDRLDARCDRLIKSLFSRGERRNQRINKLKGLPESTKRIINEYWVASTPFLKLLKLSFKNRCYIVFDLLMTLSLKKNNEYD